MPDYKFIRMSKSDKPKKKYYALFKRKDNDRDPSDTGPLGNTCFTPYGQYRNDFLSGSRCNDNIQGSRTLLHGSGPEPVCV